MKLLLDEMYPPDLAAALRDAGIDTTTVADLGLRGAPDAEVFAQAVAVGRVVLTENVADFARLTADHLIAGNHHPGVVMALASHFSRRPSGRGPLVAALAALRGQALDDRTVYLRPEA